MNSIIASLAGGPGTALLRYGVSALGGYMVARGWTDAATAQTVGGAILTAVPAIIGSLAASRSVRITKVVGSNAVESVTLATGQTLTSAADVERAKL